MHGRPITQSLGDTHASHPNRWRILGVLVLALLVTSIDHTIINVAMPRLVGDETGQGRTDRLSGKEAARVQRHRRAPPVRGCRAGQAGHPGRVAGRAGSAEQEERRHHHRRLRGGRQSGAAQPHDQR